MVLVSQLRSSKRCLSHFKSWRADHVNRNNNRAAHLLARNALHVADCVIWVEETPPVIELQIQNDVLLMDLGPYQ